MSKQPCQFVRIHNIFYLGTNRFIYIATLGFTNGGSHLVWLVSFFIITLSEFQLYNQTSMITTLRYSIICKSN